MQSPLHAAKTHLFSVIIKHSEHLKYMLLDWMSSIAVLEISPKYLHWEAKRQSVYKRQMKAYQQVFEVPSWRLNQYFGHLCLCSLKQDMMSKVWMWWRKRGSCMIYDKHWHITHINHILFYCPFYSNWNHNLQNEHHIVFNIRDHKLIYREEMPHPPWPLENTASMFHAWNPHPCFIYSLWWKPNTA